MRRAWAIAGLATLALSGCNIWFGYDDDCDDTVTPPGSIGLRNPYSGQCEGVSGGGGGSTCGDWGGAETEPALIDWAACFDECTGLGEEACLATPGCRGAYASSCPEGVACDSAVYSFVECWGVAPSGPVQGSECYGLDAYECSRHDDCVARHYAPLCGPNSPCAAADALDRAPVLLLVGNFEHCAPEASAPQPGCYSDMDCPAGTECNAPEVCNLPPDCDAAGNCDSVCVGTCVPVTPGPGSCHGEVTCDSPQPACPYDTAPGIANGCYTGYCIPLSDCEPTPGRGTCYGDVFCDSLPPTCMDGSVPGIENGCWTGQCIPVNECEMQPDVPCASLVTEAECIGRVDCSPIYVGQGCICDEATGECRCQDWNFQQCVTQ